MPNPTSGNVTVFVNDGSNGTHHMTLIDATGKKVWSGELNITDGSGNLQIDLSDQPAGIYSLIGFDKVIRLAVIKK